MKKEIVILSSIQEKAIAAGAAIILGIVIVFSVSVTWDVFSSFALYTVMLLDNILNRLDDLKRNGYRAN